VESPEPSRTLSDRPCQPGGILLVGINPSPVSVAVGHYYQGRLGQRLWSRLRRMGLLSDDADSWEDDAFGAAGNGLTDLVKRPTAAANQLPAAELVAGRAALLDKVRAWRPGMLLFAFRPPAEALLGKSIAPGRGPDLEGIPTFLLSGPYAPGGVAADIDAELLAVLRDVQSSVGQPDSNADLASRRVSDIVPTAQLVARSAGGPTQRVTAADLRAGRIRVPARSASDAKSVLPDHSGSVRVAIRGEEMVVPYNPRIDADRERSGVLSVGAARLARLVEGDEVLQVSINQDGVVRLD
jgi:double-stranded uracil-DNA glycosylase